MLVKSTAESTADGGFTARCAPTQWLDAELQLLLRSVQVSAY
jgi:hypothetical protein